MSVKPIFDDGQIQLYHGDCREILPELGPVDVVVTDPPYGDTSLSWDQPVRGWLDLIDTRQVWCFASLRFLLEHGREFAGWTYAQEVVWEKHNRRPPHTGHIEASSYTSEDGGPRLMRSVLQVRSEHGRAVHPTQKPLGILRPLVEYSCPSDGVVLDPFAGSASTLIAARELGRNAIGIEISRGYCDRALERLAQGCLASEAVA